MKHREPITAQAPRLCLDILKQPQFLIAGATESDKRIPINGLSAFVICYS